MGVRKAVLDPLRFTEHQASDPESGGGEHTVYLPTQASAWLLRYQGRDEGADTSGEGLDRAPHRQCSEVPNRSLSTQNTAYGLTQCAAPATHS